MEKLSQEEIDQLFTAINANAIILFKIYDVIDVSEGALTEREREIKELAERLRKAAEQGDAKSQNKLGYVYYFGNGDSRDYAKAAEWYGKAAEQGDADAQNILGRMYYFGNGVPKSYMKAIEWFRKAAEQGHEEAKEALAKIDIKGHILTFDGEEYFVLKPKKIDNQELWIVVTIALPLKFKLMEICVGDNGKIEKRFYDGLDHETIIQKYADEIRESMQEIREAVIQKNIT